MSKLPNAPLIEVIFEIKWPIYGADELQEVQYLNGDLYHSLKKEYPFREMLPNLGMNEFVIHNPLHRFRPGAGDYPLVQVGPGLIAFNTIDSKYFWKDYESRVLNLVAEFFKVYTFKANKKISLSLQYIDFLNFDFNKNDVLAYLKEFLHVNIEQGIFNASNAKAVKLNLDFATDTGQLSVNIGKGRKNNVDGLAIRTSITSGNITPEIDFIPKWLNDAHEICSNCFKEMTKGELHETFKA